MSLILKLVGDLGFETVSRPLGSEFVKSVCHYFWTPYFGLKTPAVSFRAPDTLTGSVVTDLCSILADNSGGIPTSRSGFFD